MRALVVFESMFGNTQQVAEAVAAGLRSRLPVECVEVGRAPAALADDVILVAVGGPTHAFGMSRPRTRRDAGARTRGPLVSAGVGIREWLAALAPARHGVVGVGFSTRIRRRLLPGSAARAAQRRLSASGYREVMPPTDFWVADVEGPLLDGELERARRWGERLAAEVTPGVRS